MLIKKFKTNKEKNILNWWNDWGLKTPDIECLPKKGYVVIYNNIKVAAGYLLSLIHISEPTRPY